MGNKPSQPQALITKANFNPDTEIIGKTFDPHYGDIKIVRDFKTKETMILKEVVLNTKQAFDAEQAYFNTRVTVKHPNVVNVIGYNSQDKHNFCSTYYKVALYIEHLEDNLQTLLETRRAAKNPFSEEELLLIADDLITGLSYFQSQGVSHGDIRPFNIFYKDQVYKLSDPSLNAQKNSNALTQAIVHGTKTYLSPELIPQVPQQKFEITSDKFKADVYSLGVTLLSLATLTNSEELYNYEKGTIDENLIRERLNNVRTNYSEFTHDLIEDMLIPEEARRPDSIVVANKVSPHKEYMRRAYQGTGVVISRTQGEGERAKRANLPTHDEETEYRTGSIEELEARIRAAIARTEETFRIVKATPGLSGVFGTAKQPEGYTSQGTYTYSTTPYAGTTDVIRDITSSQTRDPERLARSQVAQDYSSYNYTTVQPVEKNVLRSEERVVRGAIPTDLGDSSTQIKPVETQALSQSQTQPGGYTSSYVPASTYAYDVKTSGVGASGTGNVDTGLAGVKSSGTGDYGYTSNYGTTSYTVQGTTTYEPVSYTVEKTTTYEVVSSQQGPTQDVGASGTYYGIETSTVGQNEKSSAIDNLVNKFVDAVTAQEGTNVNRGSFSDHVSQVNGTQQISY